MPGIIQNLKPYVKPTGTPSAGYVIARNSDNDEWIVRPDQYVNVLDFGASGAGRIVGDAEMTSGSNILKSVSTDFATNAAAWAGWPVVVADAGDANRTPKFGFLGGTGDRAGLASNQVRLFTTAGGAVAANAGRTSNPTTDKEPKMARWGPDSTSAIAAALVVAKAQGKPLYFPAVGGSANGIGCGVYFTGSITGLTSRCHLLGDGKKRTYLCTLNAATQNLFYVTGDMGSESLNPSQPTNVGIKRGMSWKHMTLMGPGEWNGPLTWTDQANFYATGNTNPTRGIWFHNLAGQLKDVLIEDVEFCYFGREALYVGLIGNDGSVVDWDAYQFVFEFTMRKCLVNLCGGHLLRWDGSGSIVVIEESEIIGSHGENTSFLEDTTWVHSDENCTVGGRVERFCATGGRAADPTYALVNPAATGESYGLTVAYSSGSGTGLASSAANGKLEYVTKYKQSIWFGKSAQNGYSNAPTIRDCHIIGFGADFWGLTNEDHHEVMAHRQGGTGIRCHANQCVISNVIIDLFWGNGIAIAGGIIETTNIGPATADLQGTDPDTNNISTDIYVMASETQTIIRHMRWEDQNKRDGHSVHVAPGYSGNIFVIGDLFGYTGTYYGDPARVDIVDEVWESNVDGTLGGTARKVQQIGQTVDSFLGGLKTEKLTLNTGNNNPLALRSYSNNFIAGSVNFADIYFMREINHGPGNGSWTGWAIAPDNVAPWVIGSSAHLIPWGPNPGYVERFPGGASEAPPLVDYRHSYCYHPGGGITFTFNPPTTEGLAPINGQPLNINVVGSGTTTLAFSGAASGYVTTGHTIPVVTSGTELKLYFEWSSTKSKWVLKQMSPLQ